MANFTDFDTLAAEPSVALAFLEDPGHARVADVLILPGSKQTLDDLEWLRAQGLADCIVAHRGPVVGICGGLQMLGLSIEDPFGVENDKLPRTAPGLGLLSIRTVMRQEKVVRQATGRARCWGAPHFRGYEIHMGETLYENSAKPFSEITRGWDMDTIPDGAIADSGRVSGTYVHGLFDDDTFRHVCLDVARKACGLHPANDTIEATGQRQAKINRWADHLRQSLNLDLIRSWLPLRSSVRQG